MWCNTKTSKKKKVWGCMQKCVQWVNHKENILMSQVFQHSATSIEWFRCLNSHGTWLVGLQENIYKNKFKFSLCLKVQNVICLLCKCNKVRSEALYVCVGIGGKNSLWHRRGNGMGLICTWGTKCKICEQEQKKKKCIFFSGSVASFPKWMTQVKNFNWNVSPNISESY